MGGAHKSLKVALVQMPFAVTAWPSLGLSLIKSALANEGITSQVIYLNALFSEMVGHKVYGPVSIGSPTNSDLLGEWIFSESLWGPSPGRDRAFRENVFERAGWRKERLSSDELAEIWNRGGTCRRAVETFLERCLTNVPWHDYQVVGFTSVFQQHVASLSLAKRLKEKYPELFVIFGGANCEGVMGLATLRNFEFIDAVCLGEGEIAFPAFLESIINGSKSEVDGIATRRHLTDPKKVKAAQRANMDLLPIPDFDDFFEQCDESSIGAFIEPRLLIETSRGCWWGQKNHCTFCGLNGTNMAFRHKSASRALDEIILLKNKYGQHTSRLAATDNIIPYKYFSDFLPRLSELKMSLEIFYETKANLRKDHVKLYRNAGLRTIQPGIESLSTDVLKLMRKGVTALQNIQLLKWCKEFGIAPQWNMLFGFPGEQSAWYRDIPALIEKLRHLTPPGGVAPVRFDRFSPYVSEPESFGVREVHPYPAYQIIYDQVPQSEIDDLAYYFEGTFDGAEKIASYSRPIVEACARWVKDADKCMLAHIEANGATVVMDTRVEAKPDIFALQHELREVFQVLDGVTSVSAIQSATGLSSDRAMEALNALKNLDLLIEDRGHFLGLSIPISSDYQPGSGARDAIQHFIVTKGGECGEQMHIALKPE